MLEISSLLLSLVLWLASLTLAGLWTYGSAFVVLLGVVGESIAELFWRWPNESSEVIGSDIRRKRVAKASALVLMLGLTGDLIAIHLTQLETASLIKEAGDAKTSADNAADAASRANSFAEQAEQHAIKANEKADRFRLQIAQANARAKSAEARAAEATLELAKFRAPRTLTAKQQQAVISKCKPFAGTNFDLSVDPEPEPLDFVNVVEDLLISSGWSEQRPSTPFIIVTNRGKTVGVEYASGFLVEISPEKVSTFGSAGTALALALKAEGIPVEAGTNPKMFNANAIHIIIGKKQ